jgi:MarR family 2-MHQ and catechol resistance regulon transcriptional repressor
MSRTQEIINSSKGVHLWLLLWKTTKALEQFARRSVEATGVCLSDFGVLEALLHKGPLPVSALGKKILVSSGSVTAAVDRLERNGLVQRMGAENDRRSRIVHLTDKGLSLVRVLFEEHASDMEQAFASLGGPERDALAGLLRKLGHEAEHAAIPKKKNEERNEVNDRNRSFTEHP